MIQNNFCEMCSPPFKDKSSSSSKAFHEKWFQKDMLFDLQSTKQKKTNIEKYWTWQGSKRSHEEGVEEAKNNVENV